MPGVKDRYKLMKSKVGGGGFGDVHRAKRLSDGQRVAIKRLRDYKQPDCLQRFKREVTLLREYRHPGIVEVLDADLDASPPYYVMPLYGKTLKQRVGKLSPAEFITLLESLISVLAFLEERGAFHRDLKPDKITPVEKALKNPLTRERSLGNDRVGSCPPFHFQTAP